MISSCGRSTPAFRTRKPMGSWPLRSSGGSDDGALGDIWVRGHDLLDRAGRAAMAGDV
jgi:hypothetical protein